MVRCATDDQGLAANFPNNSTHVGEQPSLDFRTDRGLAILCAEDDVRQQICEAAWNFLTPLKGLLFVVVHLPTAYAVGYRSSAASRLGFAGHEVNVVAML